MKLSTLIEKLTEIRLGGSEDLEVYVVEENGVSIQLTNSAVVRITNFEGEYDEARQGVYIITRRSEMLSPWKPE